MKLSVIIPIYNVAPYLERCIRSLEDQDLPKEEFELICVNDGSPDNSKEIVERLQEEFSNIILINQENQGVSMARNNGKDRATGKYILPIDADDYVFPNRFSNVIQIAEKNEIDVLFLGFEILNQHGKRIWKTDYQKFDKGLISFDSAYFALRGNGKRDPDRSCAILFRKGLLDKHNIYYPKDVPYLEDGLFVGKVLMYSKRVSFSNNDFYIRTTRLGSATNSQLIDSDRTANGFILAVRDLIHIQKTQQFNDKQKLFLNHLIARFILLVLMPSASKRDLKTFRKRATQLRDNNLGKIDTDGVRDYKRLFALAYNISPYGYFFVKQLQLIHKLLRQKRRIK